MTGDSVSAQRRRWWETIFGDGVAEGYATEWMPGHRYSPGLLHTVLGRAVVDQQKQEARLAVVVEDPGDDQVRPEAVSAPLHHAQLDAHGFAPVVGGRAFQKRTTGLTVTPWCMSAAAWSSSSTL